MLLVRRALLATAALLAAPAERSAGITVPERPPSLAPLLYGQAPLEPQPYAQQVADAMPLKTMRGVWSVRERYDGSATRAATANITFRGPVSSPNKGEVLWVSTDGAEEQRQARGLYLLRPDGFGRDASGKGIIIMKASWKLKRAEGPYIYSARIEVPRVGADGLPEAKITEGSIELLVDKVSGRTRRLGSFEAELSSPLDEADAKMTGYDPAERAAVSIQPRMDERLVNQPAAAVGGF